MFDHYTARSEAELQNRESNGGRYSTWRNEPEPVPSAPKQPPPPRSHTYYPGLRSGVGLSPPVRLTATSNMLYPTDLLLREPVPGDGWRPVIWQAPE